MVFCEVRFILFRKSLVDSLRKYILIILSLFLVFNQLQIVRAAQGVYSSDIGTSRALGSPLLNSSFEISDWNNYEMLAFGVFLSNFCTNGAEDNYETAFSTSATQGLKGKALDALSFGSSENSTNMQALKKMLAYAVDAQKKNRKELYAKFKYRKNSMKL